MIGTSRTSVLCFNVRDSTLALCRDVSRSHAEGEPLNVWQQDTPTTRKHYLNDPNGPARPRRMMEEIIPLLLLWKYRVSVTAIAPYPAEDRPAGEACAYPICFLRNLGTLPTTKPKKALPMICSSKLAW